MEWFSDPPCTRMDVKPPEVEAGRLELAGPTAAARVAGGVFAAVGAAMTAGALQFLRAPVPLPFKAIPLVIGAVGGGFAAFGAAGAAANASVVAERGRGVTFRWHLRPLRAKHLHVPAFEIADFEIVRRETSTSDHGSTGVMHLGSSTVEVSYRLMLVTKKGVALPIEEFGTRTQARLRQETLERVLGARPKPRPLPKHRARPKRKSRQD